MERYVIEYNNKRQATINFDGEKFGIDRAIESTIDQLFAFIQQKVNEHGIVSLGGGIFEQFNGDLMHDFEITCKYLVSLGYTVKKEDDENH
jgi:hypothetical protein